MDSNTLVIFVVSSLLGYFMVRYFQANKRIAQYELDRETDMIYQSINTLRSDVEKDMEKVGTAIQKIEDNLFNEIDRRFRSFATAINDAERRIDEIETKNMVKEPTLFDNVP